MKIYRFDQEVGQEIEQYGSEKGMIAVIIEGVHFEPAKLMPLKKREEP